MYCNGRGGSPSFFELLLLISLLERGLAFWAYGNPDACNSYQWMKQCLPNKRYSATYCPASAEEILHWRSAFLKYEMTTLLIEKLQIGCFIIKAFSNSHSKFPALNLVPVNN